jgi:EpsI family protein
MPDLLKILVPVLLVAEALTVQWAGHAERVPSTPDLIAFPRQIGRWSQSSEISIEPEVQAQLRADRLLDRMYYSGTTAGPVVQAEVLVAWFNSQTKGDRQPHSPRVCLPGAGWLPESTGTVRLETPAGKLSATQYIVSKGGFRSAVLYWYQTPRRTIAGEWEAKSWILVDALRDHRTDVALVRIVVPSFNAQDKVATDAAADFARVVYPELRRELP